MMMFTQITADELKTSTHSVCIGVDTWQQRTPKCPHF